MVSGEEIRDSSKLVSKYLIIINFTHVGTDPSWISEISEVARPLAIGLINLLAGGANHQLVFHCTVRLTHT